MVIELCQRVLDGKGMSDKWHISLLVVMFKEKGDARTSNAYRVVYLLGHTLKTVERVLNRFEK